MLATNEAQVDGSQKTQLVDSAGNPISGASAAPADAKTNTSATSGLFQAFISGFNGATWDRVRTGVTALSSTLTGYLNTIPTALYRAVPASRTDGNGGPIEADIKGNLRVAEQAPPGYEYSADAVAMTHEKPAASAQFNANAYDIIAKATAGLIKGSPGNLYRIYVTNDNAAAQYYALVNKATAPSTGDTPLMYFMVPAKSTLVIEFKFGKRFSTGIGWAQCTAIAGTITTTSSDSVVTAEYS